jgi:molecular chaperone DnaK (HSP70)
VNTDYHIDSFSDSFEKTDYDSDGRIKRDYLVWSDKEYAIKVNYYIFYKWQKNPFNWKSKISVKLDNIKLPNGFDISLKKNNNDFHEYSSDYEMLLSDNSEFLVKLCQTDNYINLQEPQLVKFDVNVILIGSNIRKTINYEFLIGEDLGDKWMAFDPGTTATTIAFGSDNLDITIVKNTEGELLMPSVLVFDKQDKSKSFYGKSAEQRIKNTENYLGFRSIKKMLGFNDTNKEINKNGKELAEKLVSDIFDEVKSANAEIQTAKRAIVAIPNNYTATKIKDMLACIESLGQFKEIRTIYEAEAVIFYYLLNKSDLNGKFECKPANDDETILVFDMGGATINATVAKISKQDKDIYEVNILSKISYGIGGDSIDYCILKSIFDFAVQISELQQINIFDENIKENLSETDCKRIKENLIELSFKIKKKIIENQRKTELISANDLQIYLQKAGAKNLYVDAESDFYRIFKTESRFCILRNKYFKQLIFNSVSEAIREVWKNAGNLKIGKIILSGRSCSFPNIEATVNNEFSYPVDIVNLSKNGDIAKTAVAEGACWYGVNNNCIELNNLKTSANFGFVKTNSPDKKDIKFINLISAGQNFAVKEQGIKTIEKVIDFRDRFNFNGNKVNFYQIMGSDAKKIIAENEKHKFSKLATIKLVQESEKIGMRVNENDDVNCSVRLVAGATIKEKGVVADQEIADANEEHYTWIVK